MKCRPIQFFVILFFSSYGSTNAESPSVSKDDFMSKIGIEKYDYEQRYLGSFLKLHDSKTPKHDEKMGVSFHCDMLFEDLVSKTGVPPLFPGPKEPPNYWLNSYTLGGQVKYETWYIENNYEFANSGAVQNHTWPKDLIDSLGKEECKCGGYGGANCKDTIAAYDDVIKGKHGLIIGSESPWAEAAFIAAGAEITTIEYMKIYSDHPKLHTMTPVEAASSFLDNKFQLADFAFTYSSLEHDGLGRYGDPLNPNGDLEAIARIHCLLKPNGTLFLGLPVDSDCVVWNAHRVYGNVRLSLIFSFWEFLDVIGSDRVPGALQSCNFGNQPVMVLRKLPHHHQ